MQVMFYFSFFCEDFLCFREMMASANCPRGTTKNAIYKDKKRKQGFAQAIMWQASNARSKYKK